MTQSPAGHTANLLGALALAVSDRVSVAMADRSGRSESAAAALSAIDQFLDKPSIDRLSQVLGLSQSGTVRLVDRIEEQGLVQRGSGVDARTTTVQLTPAGRRVARGLQETRLEILEGFLQPLSGGERRALDALIGRVLVGMMREPGATRWTCRLCDLSACGRPAGHCPLEREARRRYG
ncbi:MAG TPA: MarR family transcriptional regulator [Acidimicrobiales bacterium]|nr:MarR family transcriptional regulator [Acidimicrobiales bacterium]